MLIQALCGYYDALAASGKALADGYSAVRVHNRVSLAPDGKVAGIEAWLIRSEQTDKKGKVKERFEPHVVAMFRRTEKPGIESNVVEHRPLYLFGLNLEKDGSLTPDDRTDKARKSHQAFVARNLAFIEGVDSPIVNAFRAFLTGWRADDETENPFLLGLGKGYATAGFVFCLAGQPGVMLQDDARLKAKWEQTLLAEENAEGKELGQCAISGQHAEIALLHDKITGMQGGLATGTKLVCFNNDSESSYGAAQALNSGVSVAAMRKYTQALNALTSGRAHSMTLGDVTVVYFAQNADRRAEALAAGALTGSDADEDDLLDASDTNKLLAAIYADVRNGVGNTERLLRENDIDPSVDYYIAGFKPNASRLAVKFVYRRALGEVVLNAARHQADMAFRADAKPVTVWQIAKQLVSPKADNPKGDPALTTKLLEAVMYGYRYPPFLLATVVRRVQTDSDAENNAFIKLNPVRAGIIKACLNREARMDGKEEEIHMALDRTNAHPAYLCGRLFAVLERIQQQANPGLNRTITDAYFASASTRPALIFPRLVKLAQNHLKKLEYAGWWNRQIGDICALMGGEYPDTLPLDDQGRFILGYYQEKYAPSEKKQDAANAQKEEETHDDSEHL